MVKTATPFQVLPGGTATYTYAVSNTGNVPLAGVHGSIHDKCSPVSYVSGDLNDNGLLDAAENGSAGQTWIFTCSTILTEDTTNVVTVDGTPVLPDGTPIGEPVLGKRRGHSRSHRRTARNRCRPDLDGPDGAAGSGGSADPGGQPEAVALAVTDLFT